jgi:hypothetical protein
VRGEESRRRREKERRKRIGLASIFRMEWKMILRR